MAALPLIADATGVPVRKPEDPLNEAHIDIAASLQAIFEGEVLKMARFVRTETGLDNCSFAAVAHKTVSRPANSAGTRYSAQSSTRPSAATWAADSVPPCSSSVSAARECRLGSTRQAFILGANPVPLRRIRCPGVFHSTAIYPILSPAN